MSYKDKLSERRNALAIEARRVLDTHKGADFGKDQLAQYDTLTAEICDIDARLSTEQARLDKIAEESFDDVDNFKGKPSASQSTAAQVLNTLMRKRDRDLSDAERVAIRNTMSTTTGSQGGYTVASEIGDKVIEKLKAYGAMRDVATIITTDSGNPLSYPTSDGTSETGEWLAENAAGSDSDPSFGTVALTAYKAGSKIITVPIELLEDAAFDVAGFVMNRMAQRIGRTTSAGYTTGTGSAQPYGVAARASAGKVGANGQTTTFIYDDLVDLYESVDQAYIDSGNCMFMFSQTVRKALRKMVDTAGRPIWTPSYDVGSAAGMPDELLGVKVKINNDLAVPAASAKPILFGDFSHYIIRDVRQVVLMKFEDSNYLTKGQIGFMGWVRTAGELSNTSAVKYYQNAAI